VFKSSIIRPFGFSVHNFEWISLIKPVCCFEKKLSKTRNPSLKKDCLAYEIENSCQII